jgi:magnesium transporter
MGESPAHLLYKIIDAQVDELMAGLTNIERKLDIIEDAVFEDKVSASMQITSLRRQITNLRRIVIPLRRVLSELPVEAHRFSHDMDLAHYFSDVRDHIDKVVEEIEASKETVEIYKDTDFTNHNQKSNKILGILTILFTLTIPVTVVSSFYGMNVEIPGTVQSGPWTFLGYYTTMIIIIVISIIPSLAMLWFFYRKKWMTF